MMTRRVWSSTILLTTIAVRMAFVGIKRRRLVILIACFAKHGHIS